MRISAEVHSRGALAFELKELAEVCRQVAGHPLRRGPEEEAADSIPSLDHSCSSSGSPN